MSSPFPGMDPFLEVPAGSRGLHHRLLTSISNYLTERVSPAFYVDIEETVYISELGDPGRRAIAPDVYVAREPTGPYRPAGEGDIEITAPTIVEPLVDAEIHDEFLSVYDTESRTVVTVLELLSPANKVSGAQGRAAFLRKREEVMHSNAHWIEIDLLRAGERPEDVNDRSNYYALLKRTGSARYEIWYFDLRDQLPVIAVPLRAPYSDVPLPLSAVLAQAYEWGNYAHHLNYSRTVSPPPLSPTDRAWVEEQLHQWAARKG